jgi:hypothetical protein
VEDALIGSVLYLSRWPCCPISGVSVAGISHDPVDCNGNVLWIGDRGRCRGRSTPFGHEVTLKVTVYRHLGPERMTTFVNHQIEYKDLASEYSVPNR